MSRHPIDAARFWAKINKNGPAPAHCPGLGPCWLWTGHCQKGTHPYGTSSGRLTHRLAWVLTNGPVPDGLRVLHRCDVCNCCNPAHLWLGTQKDNVDDMRAKGRQPVTPPLLDRVCLHCGTAFEVRPCEADQKYCSHPCSMHSPNVGRKAGARLSAEGRAKFRASRGWSLIEKQCPGCGHAFTVRPYRADQVFCTAACRHSNLTRSPEALAEYRRKRFRS